MDRQPPFPCDARVNSSRSPGQLSFIEASPVARGASLTIAAVHSCRAPVILDLPTETEEKVAPTGDFRFTRVRRTCACMVLGESLAASRGAEESLRRRGFSRRMSASGDGRMKDLADFSGFSAIFRFRRGWHYACVYIGRLGASGCSRVLRVR